MGEYFSGKRVLLTGHTGFKGAWLLVWLDMLGAKVCGVSLEPPTKPSLFSLLNGADMCSRHEICDIRDAARLSAIVGDFAPNIVIHMAAQALVLPSIEDPAGTISANVAGTANVLDASRRTESIERILVVTSDKVYANDGRPHAFVEGDRLGGHDPYSASKAAAEIIVDSFRAIYFHGRVPVATVRAGNVIGGGDWAPHRVIPDAVRALEAGKPLVLRRPEAVRPWQHVLDPLSGYLETVRQGIDGPLNFGPEAAGGRTVAELVEAFGRHFGGRPGWTLENADRPAEATYLALSSARAREKLGWRSRLPFEQAIEWTASWYAARTAGKDLAQFTRRQIGEFGRL
ncbi:MAG: CDP-glucose 4,6-dehydratase [Rhodospirillales bacterium]|nr:CDP-glucose 4,6-dehydratase [Rhodospirillales bacterium]